MTSIKKGLLDLRGFHPMIYILLIGTALARAANAMSIPFLAIYLSKETDLNPILIGLIVGAGALSSAFGGFFGGVLSDQFGRKRIMLLALYIWGLVFIGFFYTHATLIFLILNILNGLCRTFFEPVAQALMSDLAPSEKRIRIFSMRYLAINVGVTIGPLLGAYIALEESSVAFLFTGFFYILYAVSLSLLLRLFNISEINKTKKEIVTIVSAAKVIMKDSYFRRLLIGGIIVTIAYSQLDSTLPQYLNQSFVNGIEFYAIMLSLNALLVVIFQIPLTSWIESKGSLFAIILGNIFISIGYIGFCFSPNLVFLLISIFVFTVGEILYFPAASAMVDRIAPDHLRGTYYGAQSFLYFGKFIGPILGGFLLNQLGESGLFVTMVFLTLIGTVFYRIKFERNTTKIEHNNSF
ncbi:MDR family MFS transporter [Paenibacillus sp. SAF-068]|uniref:MDR family MFS transporter n=1 Tax=Paenibacillus sp. SAF-068 TaxID=3436864 RepID=UPI003F7F9659